VKKIKTAAVQHPKLFKKSLIGTALGPESFRSRL